MDNAQGNALLSSCRTQAVDWAQEQFSLYLTHLEQAFARAVTGSEDELEQAHFATHRKKIERFRQTTEQHFHRQLERRLSSPQAPRILHDTDRAYDRLAEALTATGHDGLLGLRRALLPAAFVQCCRDTLRAMEFDDRAEAFALGLFHEHFVATLPGLYNDLCDLLVTSTPPPNAGLTAWIAHIERRLADNSLNAASRSLAVARLRELRRQLTEAPRENRPLRERWSDPYPDESPAEEIDDRALMEETRRLFQPLFASDSVPDNVKALLSRLQPIALETALRDREHFLQPLHPVRQLINHLAATVKYWPRTDEVDRRRMLKTLAELAERAGEEFRGNAQLFEELKRDFEEYCRQYVRTAQPAARPDSESTMRRRIERLIQRRIAGYPYPPEVNRLLFGPWSRVLLHYWRQAGARSEVFRSALARIDDILWYVQPHKTWADKKHAGALEPVLGRALQEGFEAIGLEAGAARATLKRLRRLQQHTAATGRDAPTEQQR